jgi:hypothetical protein
MLVNLNHPESVALTKVKPEHSPQCDYRRSDKECMTTMSRFLLLAALALFFAQPAWSESSGGSWRIEDVAASRKMFASSEEPAAVSAARHLLLAVEDEGRQLAIIDANRLALLTRLTIRPGLVAPPAVSPDGRYAYLLSRDGWIDQYDLAAQRPVAEIRAGLEARGLALSGDGLWLMAALAHPGGLTVIKTGDLSPFRLIPGRDDKGKTSEVSSVFAAPDRSSFVASLPNIAEIWELSHDENAEPVYSGMVHSFEKGIEEGVGEAQPFARRRTKMEGALEGVFFSPGFVEIGGASPDGRGGAVYNLDARRRAARLPRDIAPKFMASIPIEMHGQPALLVPLAGSHELGVLDLQSWKVPHRIMLRGQASFLKKQPNANLVLASGFSGKDKDAVQLVDLHEMRAERILRPAPGKALGPLTFSPDGKTAYLLVTESEGGLAAIDTASLKTIKMVPLKKPSILVHVLMRPSQPEKPE